MSSLLGHSPLPMGSSSPHRNIMIVGDVGVGKSSLINLITGKDEADTSSGVKSCTLQSREYGATFGGVQFALHDTAGLHEAQTRGNMKEAEYLDAVHQACRLISKLEQSGGIHLLVFCVRSGRISTSTQHTYRLFVEVFCNRQVPVVIAVTGLEDYQVMEEWWGENEKHIDEYGLRSHGHACITATRGRDGRYSDQYDVSRGIIRDVILNHSDRDAWKEERITWVKRLMLHMRSWLPPRIAKALHGRWLRRKLIKRCGLSTKDAERVIEEMEAQSTSTEENQPWFDDKSRVDRSRTISLSTVSYRH